VAAAKLLLEQRAQLHLQRIAAAGQPQIEIEKAMVDALERQGEGETLGNFAFNAGKTRHGINSTHSAASRATKSKSFLWSISINCSLCSFW